MKIIFLDCDGVILHYRTLMASPALGHSKANPDPMLCGLLRLAGQMGVKIVVSSSWRDCESQRHEKLTEGGLMPFLHEDWRTAEIGCRSKEIAEWLARHPEVVDYRIADDDKFNWTPEQDSKWLECSAYDGMPAMTMKDLAEWAGVVRTKRERIAA